MRDFAQSSEEVQVHNITGFTVYLIKSMQMSIKKLSYIFFLLIPNFWMAVYILVKPIIEKDNVRWGLGFYPLL